MFLGHNRRGWSKALVKLPAPVASPHDSLCFAANAQRARLEVVNYLHAAAVSVPKLHLFGTGFGGFMCAQHLLKKPSPRRLAA